MSSWIDESCKLTLVPRVGPRGLCDVFGSEDMGYESYWAKKGANHRDWAKKGANGYVDPIGTRDKVERVAEF